MIALDTPREEKGLKDRDIENYARKLAHALPERPPEEKRRRKRFEVQRVWSEGARYLSLEVDVDEPEFVASHTRPAQYATFQYGGVDPRFLVIASGPDETGWQFLIDRQTDLGAVAEAIEPGHHVLVSPAEGSGFPTEAVVGSSVLIFTTGAGIASVHPLLQYWEAHPDLTPAALAIYYGESEREDFAYRDQFEQWRARGARLFQAVENLAHPEQGFRYVQHAFEEDEPDLDQTHVFISGAPVMMELIIAKLLRLGVPPEFLHINV